MAVFPKAFITTAATRLHLHVAGDLKYGWHEKSCGVKVTDSASKSFWLRLLTAANGSVPRQLWAGNESANNIKDVKRPRLFAAEEWEYENVIFRAEVLEFVDQSVISGTTYLSKPVSLDLTWFASLKLSLENIVSVQTERVSIRQDLISRRLRERFEHADDTLVKTWETAHCDLHWGNLTHPECWILDWESWGKAPIGIDAAFLYCHSLLVPEIAAQIRKLFAEKLDQKEGIMSQLFACAELMRMTEVYGDNYSLYRAIERHAEFLAPQLGWLLKKSEKVSV